MILKVTNKKAIALRCGAQVLRLPLCRQRTGQIYLQYRHWLLQLYWLQHVW